MTISVTTYSGSSRASGIAESAILNVECLAISRPSLHASSHIDVFILWSVSNNNITYKYKSMILNNSSRGKTRTFKPRKDVPEGTKQYQLRKYAEATLVHISGIYHKLFNVDDSICRALETYD